MGHNLAPFVANLRTNVDDSNPLLPHPICGEFQFVVLNAWFGSPPSSITLTSGGELVYRPSLWELGVTSLKLRISLPNWPTSLGGLGYVDVDFNVKATRCAPAIDISAVNVPDFDLTWGESMLGIPFSSYIANYQQVPNCGYPFTYAVKAITI
jgi:hypothetical protein